MKELFGNKKQGIVVSVHDYPATALEKADGLLDCIILPPDTPLKDGCVPENVMNKLGFHWFDDGDFAEPWGEYGKWVRCLNNQFFRISGTFSVAG